MGKFHKKRRNFKKSKDGGLASNKPRGATYKEIEKENEKFWNYYKAQGLIPEEEWQAFREALQKDLPVSYRIQGCHKDRDQLVHEMESRFFGDIEASGDAKMFVPKRLPWYQYAYQTPMSRTVVRSHPVLAQLHNFLVTEAELGNLSRQEAVSMIPPLLLAPQADHYVLDMCAAPGSKTTQLMEMMHEETPNPSGMIVANDLDKKRCYMLIHHTLKRFHVANCVITCEDAARMPPMRNANDEVLQFDRVLADVICSGDGTLRKNPEIWLKWSPQEGLGLHRMQIAIAKRGAEKLKVGGRMVYSTCSMNPIEDEAAVAQILRESKGALKLVDAHGMLPGLKAYRGVSTWKVYDRDMREYMVPSEVPEYLQKMICASCFPPTEEEREQFNLSYCMRLAPHLQDTGGFFVALIEKVAEVDFDDTIKAPRGPAYKRQKMFKDEPFTFLVENDERWLDMRNHYGLSDDFHYQNLFGRVLAEKDAKCRQLFFTNDAVKSFVERNMASVSIQNAGMKMFSRTEQKVEATKFRLSQEGIRYVFPYMTKQKVKMSREDMLKVLKTDKALVEIESLDGKVAIREQNNGSLVVYENEEDPDPVCTWVGFHTIAPYISKEERIHLLRMMGVDCSEIEEMMRTKRKEKAAVDRENARLENGGTPREEDNGDGAVKTEVDDDAPNGEADENDEGDAVANDESAEELIKTEVDA